ncbi:FAD:protein FMN transferase [Selenomonas sp.]|uniref:FAD:protein FMN transferase n=1 Tax=Selenomonas sp. TaxID=2053611 RepID=UPI0025E5374E|nr:FAD:protein FMN transferase [Selenomonas sp.]MBQ1867500.1 FAD:protein FMN transferase [Selenomonas sp.]
MRKLWLAAGIVLLLVMGTVLLTGCGRKEPVQKTVMVMDTVVTLTAVGEKADDAVRESIVRLQEIDGMASPHGENSDLKKLADAAGNGAWIPLHPEVFHMLEVSQEYSRISDGAWDVTAGPLVELWGIGTDKAKVPTETELAQAKAKTGWQKLELDPETKCARLREPGMSLDLGGIAKGFAADEVRKIYEQHGIRDGLINLGASSIYALGKNTKGGSWRVGIRHPRSEDKESRLGVVELSNAALSTSGDYERFFEQAGVRYHHILDPRTGRPANSGAVSDTIVVDGSLPDAGMISDLLTTAVFVLGPEEGKAFLAKLPTEIRGMICDRRLQLRTAHGFDEILQQVQQDFSLAE